MTQDSEVGDNAPAAADEQPATLTVAGARGQPRASSSPASSAAGCSHVDHDLEVDVLYSGESDSPSDSKPSGKSDRTAKPKTKTAAPLGSLDVDLRDEMFGSSDESENSSLGSNRSHSYSY